MKLYRSDKVRFIAGFIFIIGIYSAFYIFFLENSNLVLPSKVRHLIKFLATIAVYFVGTYHLGKLADSWMSVIWHIIHISGLGIITAIGLFDWFIYDVTLNIRLFANSIQELLISPLLYLAMGLINRTLKREVIV
ncbi:hypothetical protein [Mariniflexile sp.]|uniref:hypothetical protein n=1 Tax=Mariniflexile sp. TaxID=1979402 RepID=UPI0035682689